MLGDSFEDLDEDQIAEKRRDEATYAPFFWQAIRIRYPEYVNYNVELHKMLGCRD